MNLRMTLALSAACLLPVGLRADENDAKLVRPFVTSQTAAVAMLDLSSPGLSTTLKALFKYPQNMWSPKEIESTIERLRAAEIKRLYLVVSPYSLKHEEWAFVLAATSADKAPAVRAAFTGRPGFTIEEKDGVVFFGESNIWKRFQEPPVGDDAPSPLLARIETWKPNPLAMVARLPEAHRKAIAELSPHLPTSLGGGPTAPLLEGLKAVEFIETAGDRPTVSLTLHAGDATTAKQMEKLVAKGLLLAQSVPAKATPAEKAARSLAAEVKPMVVENRVELSVDLTNAKLQTTLKEALGAAEENKRQTIVRNNLKMIALAMHNYHDTNGSFPPGGTVDKTGKPLLSWRVHILPYLDQYELYKKFKLDEPWDSEHNRKLIDQMPKEYAGVSPTGDGKTSILGFSGPGALFPKPGEAVPIKEIKDGTSNTIMCIAAPASQAVIWTKPDDLSIDDPALLTKVGAETIVAVYCDGSAQTFPMPSSLKDLLARITINGREVVERP